MIHFLRFDWLPKPTGLEKPEDRATYDDSIRRFNELLTGPRTATHTTVDPESGLKPPPWWRGDEDASRSSLAALTAL